MDNRSQAVSPVHIFYSYAPEDEKLRRKLEDHLSFLRRQKFISDWHNHKILPGDDRQQSSISQLDSASIILLLISQDYLASDSCYTEMQRAMERQEAGLARVIPIILRSADWRSAPFAHLGYLPDNGKPVVEWPNRDSAFHIVAQGIRAVVTNAHDANDISNSTHTSPTVKQLKREDQNRLNFLKRVRTIWIEGMLAHSLYNATLITLGLHEQPDAIANPWRLLVQETDQTSRPLPTGTRITQVYDEVDGLLILGEPGAGKTTLLLDLANNLLERALSDPNHPLPAIFNLSSWAEKHPPLASWLVEELYDKYKVPRELANMWIESDFLLPLLDGLDEVALAQRSACIAAINNYRQEHSVVPLVVCSRNTEYQKQPVRVSLQKSVLLQPLTTQQIDKHLSSAGEQLAALRQTLHDNKELQELAATPLMLNILMLTYQGKTLDDLIAIQSPELRQLEVFTQYITRMFQRRNARTPYTAQQTIHWLGSLARQMKQHEQTEFYIERLQRTWLINSRLRRFYHISIVLVCALISGMIGGLLWVFAIGIGIAGLIGGLSFGFGAGLISGLRPDMRPTETFTWSWDVVRQRWLNIPLFMLLGSLMGGIKVTSDPSNQVSIGGMIAGGLFGILGGVLFNVLTDGMVKTIPNTNHITKPNQEIRRSAYNSLLIALVSIFFGLLFIPVNKLAIIWVSTFGMISILSFGGLACIEHVILRLLLWRSGQLPWDLPRFLDYAAERILLRKVGGGYIFIHRLLLDYFAARNATHGD